MVLFDRVKEFADRKKMSLNEVEEAVGFSKNTTYKWKKQTPNADNVRIIAEYFGTSTDYLLGSTDNPAPVQSVKESSAKYETEYSETELRKALENVMSFDGQPITENDKDAIIAFMMGRVGK